MTKAPGYERKPDHRTRERLAGERAVAVFCDTVVADSMQAILVEDDGHRLFVGARAGAQLASTSLPR